MKKTTKLFTFILCLLIGIFVAFSSNVKALELSNYDSISALYKQAKKDNIISNNLTATLTDQNGNVIKIPVYELKPKFALQSIDNSYTTTCVVGLNEKLFSDSTSIKPFGSITVEDDDGTYVYAKLTITYTKLNATASSPARYLLTKVSGSWTVKTYQINLANRRVAYACQSIFTNAQYKYPTGDSFSYNTGYSNYVYDAVGAIVGAQMNVTVKRGTGSWQFDVYNNVVDQVPGLNDFFS